MAMTTVKHRAHMVIKPAAGILAAAVAITTTLNVASAKYTVNTGTFTQKSLTLVSRIIGPQMTGQIAAQVAPGVPFNNPAQGIAPLGPINVTTFSGIAILIIDYVIKEFSVPYYSTYASPFIKALGIGLTAGGVIGGLLDPPAGGSTGGRSGGSGGGFSFANAGLGRSVMGFTGIN